MFSLFSTYEIFTKNQKKYVFRDLIDFERFGHKSMQNNTNVHFFEFLDVSICVKCVKNTKKAKNSFFACVYTSNMFVIWDMKCLR